MKRFLLVAALACATPVAAQESPHLPSVELPAALDRVLVDYAAAWQAGDADSLAALFTPDGFVSSPSGWIRGRDAIRAQYASAGGDLRLRALAWAADGDDGWIVGAYGYGDDAATVDRGKFVLALRRDADGTWRIAADLDNSNRPPPN